MDYESFRMEFLVYTVGPFQVNTYLVIDATTKSAVVIDPGGAKERIKDDIDKRGLKVELILLTHGHIDHILEAEELRKELKVPLAVHPADRQLVEAAPQQAAIFGLGECLAPRVGMELFDGQTLAVGGLKIKVLHTPGHSPGSVVFVCGEDAFVGDLIFSGSIGRTDLPGGDYDTLMHSIWKKLAPLGRNMRLHPGHGPATTLGDEMRSNPFLLSSSADRF